MLQSTCFYYILINSMSGVLLRQGVPLAYKLSRAEKLKFFKAGAYSSFAQEKLLNYGYNKLRKGRMSYRSRSGYRNSYSRGNRSYALQYYNRRPRRLAGTKRDYMQISQDSNIATTSDVKRQIYDSKRKKVEVLSYTSTAQTDQLKTIIQVGSGIDNGVSRGDRIADRIHISHLRLECNILNPNALHQDNCTVRLALLSTKRPLETDFGNQLFEAIGDSNNPVDFNTGNNPRQLLSQFNKDLMTVHFDRRIRLLADNSDAQGRQRFLKTLFIPLNKKFSYNTSADPSVSILPHMRLIMFVQKDSTSATTLGTPINVEFRMFTHYTDT